MNNSTIINKNKGVLSINLICNILCLYLLVYFSCLVYWLLLQPLLPLIKYDTLIVAAKQETFQGEMFQPIGESKILLHGSALVFIALSICYNPGGLH